MVKLFSRQQAGRLAHSNGEHFERMIESSCYIYKFRNIAFIEKTPEPMKPLRPYGNGQFVACFISTAQPDYKGTLKGGQAICFEAKSTMEDKIRFDRVKPVQLEALKKHKELGAETFILVGFFNDFAPEYFKIPIAVWENMKELYGRLYIKKSDIRKYQVKFGTHIEFLPEEGVNRNPCGITPHPNPLPQGEGIIL